MNQFKRKTCAFIENVYILKLPDHRSQKLKNLEIIDEVVKKATTNLNNISQKQLKC